METPHTRARTHTGAHTHKRRKEVCVWGGGGGQGEGGGMIGIIITVENKSQSLKTASFSPLSCRSVSVCLSVSLSLSLPSPFTTWKSGMLKRRHSLAVQRSIYWFRNLEWKKLPKRDINLSGGEFCLWGNCQRVGNTNSKRFSEMKRTW